MNDHFEQQKNVKAGGYTLAAAGLVLFFILIIGWKVPAIVETRIDEGIEVNLGNSDFGSGDIAPMVPGEPAPEPAETRQAAVPPSQQQAEEKTEEPDENDPEPSLVKPAPKPKAVVKPVVTPPIARPVQVKEQPAPPQPKPKATMGQYSGGKGPGGNNQDGFNNVKNQGIAGGNGDQGKPNGNINSDSYKGNGGTGKSGVSIQKGLTGRRVMQYPSFEDDFNENAKVAVDIQVDENGRVKSAVYQARGSTTSNGTLKAIAIRKALQLKFNAGDDESSGTMMFNFRLKN